MRPILRKGIDANPVKTGLPSVYAPHADAVFVLTRVPVTLTI
jgi:hypothetical protein